MSTKIADIKYNDVVDCEEGFCVSFWVQGCPWHCKGCHNPQTWDFMGGKELPPDFLKIIDNAIAANGIQRNFSVLGGEPLCLENKSLVNEIVAHVRNTFPNIKIYIWTGDTIEHLKKLNDSEINYILNNIDVLIDGPFIQEKRDITLKLRGSSNQRILCKGKDF